MNPESLYNALKAGFQTSCGYFKPLRVLARLMQPYRDCSTCLRELLRPDTKLKETVSRTLLWQVKDCTWVCGGKSWDFMGFPCLVLLFLLAFDGFSWSSVVFAGVSVVFLQGSSMLSDDVLEEEEMHIKQGFNEVEEIVNMNLDNMSKVLELYEPFKFLLSASRRAVESLLFEAFASTSPQNPAYPSDFERFRGPFALKPAEIRRRSGPRASSRT